MNLCVHTVMYGYFAFRAARLPLPRFVQPMITVLQLIQMIIGCLINIIAFQYKREGYFCLTSYDNIIVSLILYAAYLLLFAQFFYANYFQKGTNKNKKERTE